MAAFDQTELKLIDALATGKSAKKIAADTNLTEDTVHDRLEALKAKLDASSQAEIPDRFVALTGWTNPAKDYPA